MEPDDKRRGSAGAPGSGRVSSPALRRAGPWALLLVRPALSVGRAGARPSRSRESVSCHCTELDIQRRRARGSPEARRPRREPGPFSAPASQPALAPPPAGGAHVAGGGAAAGAACRPASSRGDGGRPPAF